MSNILIAPQSQSQSYFTTDGGSVSKAWCRAHSGTFDQILLPVSRFQSESCCLVRMGRPLWREDGSAICIAITQWSRFRRTRNHTLLSHLRLLQPGGPGSRIYIPQEQGVSAIPPGAGFPLRRLLRLAGLRWMYFNPPSQGQENSPVFEEALFFCLQDRIPKWEWRNLVLLQRRGDED
jgi:hypothetical protein